MPAARLKSPRKLTRAGAMRRALALALSGMRRGDGGPFGAVVVRNGRVVGSGWNRVLATRDPTAHAEMVAIRAACRRLRRHSLAGCELFTSCEPCPMCLAASHWARLDRIWFAAPRAAAAAAGFDDAQFYRELARTPERRALPLRPLLLRAGAAPFRHWAAKPDRQIY